MKKLTLTTVLLLFVASVSLHAQNFTLGARGIMQIGVGTYLEDDAAFRSPGVGIDSQTTIDWGGAAFAKWNFIGDFGVQAEVVYIHNSIDWLAYTGSVTNKANYSCNSITIPLMLVYDIHLSSFITVSPYAGSAIMFVLGDLILTSTSGSGTTTSDEYKTKDPIIWGIVAGANVALSLGPGDVVLDVRYHPTFNDLYAIKDGATYDICHFGGLQIGVGYQFAL